MPLRERPSDIPAIIKSRLQHEQLLTARVNPFQIDEAALTALTFYDWPDNIRQLQNIASRLTARVTDNETITQADVYSQLPYEIPLDEGSLFLPATARIIQANEDLFTYIARVQLLAIEAAAMSEGNHTAASKRLGYRRPSLVALKQKLRPATIVAVTTKTPPFHLSAARKGWLKHDRQSWLGLLEAESTVCLICAVRSLIANSTAIQLE